MSSLLQASASISSSIWSCVPFVGGSAMCSFWLGPRSSVLLVEHVEKARVLVEIDERLAGQAGRHVFRPDDWPREDGPTQLVEQLEVVYKQHTLESDSMQHLYTCTAQPRPASRVSSQVHIFREKGHLRSSLRAHGTATTSLNAPTHEPCGNRASLRNAAGQHYYSLALAHLYWPINLPQWRLAATQGLA